MSKDYLDTNEASEFICLSKSTMSKLRLFGGGPIYLRLGRKIVYRKTDLEAWVSERAKNNTSEYMGTR